MLITKSKEWILDDTIIALDLAQRMLEDTMNFPDDYETEVLIKETHSKLEECKERLTEMKGGE